MGDQNEKQKKMLKPSSLPIEEAQLSEEAE